LKVNERACFVPTFATSHFHLIFIDHAAKIMDFGDGMAAYSIKMSHAIGDGTTFYQIVSQSYEACRSTIIVFLSQHCCISFFTIQGEPNIILHEWPHSI